MGLAQDANHARYAMSSSEMRGIGVRAPAWFAVWCVVYAIYLAWLSPRVPIAVATLFDLLLVPAAFGALSVLALEGIRLRLLIVPVAAFLIPWFFSGPGDPAKPGLRVIALLGMTVTAAVGAIVAVYARKRLTRTQPRIGAPD